MEKALNFRYDPQMLVQPIEWYSRACWNTFRNFFLVYYKSERRHKGDCIFYDLPAELLRIVLSHIDPLEGMMCAQPVTVNIA